MVDGAGCLLCQPEDADRELGRMTVWEDQLWRLALVVRGSPIRGFGHLEPKRHIPHITDLDGPEAVTLGRTLARVTAALKAATGADLVYVQVFGERVAHLHLNLAPHSAGDPLTGGAGLISAGASAVQPSELAAVAQDVRARLTG